MDKDRNTNVEEEMEVNNSSVNSLHQETLKVRVNHLVVEIPRLNQMR